MPRTKSNLLNDTRSSHNIHNTAVIKEWVLWQVDQASANRKGDQSSSEHSPDRTRPEHSPI